MLTDKELEEIRLHYQAADYQVKHGNAFKIHWPKRYVEDIGKLVQEINRLRDVKESLVYLAPEEPGRG